MAAGVAGVVLAAGADAGFSVDVDDIDHVDMEAASFQLRITNYGTEQEWI